MHTFFLRGTSMHFDEHLTQFNCCNVDVLYHVNFVPMLARSCLTWHEERTTYVQMS